MKYLTLFLVIGVAALLLGCSTTKTNGTSTQPPAGPPQTEPSATETNQYIDSSVVNENDSVEIGEMVPTN